MADEQPQGLSKSAKRRAAAKRAKENAAPENDQAPAPAAPAPAEQPKEVKPKAKAKAPVAAAAPAEQPKEAKAKAKAQAPAPAAEPKAKAKAKAEPKAAPKAEPKAEPAEAKPAAKPAAKAEGKAKAQPAGKKAASKAAAKPAEEAAPPKHESSVEKFVQLDDGTGPEWEVSTGISKSKQRRKDRTEAEKAEAKASGLKPGQTPQHVPGMAPAAPAKATEAAAPAASQAVTASPSQIAAAAAAAVAERAAAAAAAVAAAEKERESNTSTATVKVPDAKIGVVIGPKGSKIKLIQEKTGARIDTTGDVFTITGPPAGVSMAETAVKELVEKGYCAMEYDDFSENFVAVHPSYFPEIIGKGGVVIRKIKDELGVSVKIPEAPKNPPAGKKYKVILAGSNQAVEKAKDVINEIMMYYHHPVTHEGYVHEEVEVAQWAYSFIIGKAGSELRHIQNNYKVKMNIPREHSVNQKVVIVGEPYGVERAKVYVEKLVWNAEHMPRGRGAADQAEDTWGDEGEDEPWMKDYIYKR
mmetsp:Transcript_50103/g.156818  ORF Transcript_50103/g.156818 Transcript_50103/m.156818 type:complete len:526 (+) Transcript_50103:57-1634(+)